MSVALDIARTYQGPRDVLRRRVAPPESEPRALVVLFAGCLLMFVAQWPVLSRAAYEDPTIPLWERFSGALFGWLFVVPLAFYALAALSHAIALLFKGKANWYQARMALFWALLSSGPLWLLNGLTLGFVGPGLAATITGSLAGLAFLYFWGAGLLDMERGSGRAA